MVGDEIIKVPNEKWNLDKRVLNGDLLVAAENHRRRISNFVAHFPMLASKVHFDYDLLSSTEHKSAEQLMWYNTCLSFIDSAFEARVLLKIMLINFNANSDTHAALQQYIFDVRGDHSNLEEAESFENYYLGFGPEGGLYVPDQAISPMDLHIMQNRGVFFSQGEYNLFMTYKLADDKVNLNNLLQFTEYEVEGIKFKGKENSVAAKFNEVKKEYLIVKEKIEAMPVAQRDSVRVEQLNPLARQSMDISKEFKLCQDIVAKCLQIAELHITAGKLGIEHDSDTLPDSNDTTVKGRAINTLLTKLEFVDGELSNLKDQ